MTVLGNLIVLLGLVTATGAAVLFFRAANGKPVQPQIPRQVVKIHAVFVVLASLLLLIQLLSHDFSNGYVFSYSDRSLPLHFLLSSFYAGQEGSFLFWALCSSILALAVLRYSTMRRTDYQVMTVFMAVQSILLLLVFTRSPFAAVWDLVPQMQKGQIPPDGRGLNPLLQNIWMVIHPPVLFIGFAATAVPFALAIAGLWKNEREMLVGQALPWVLFGASVLGLGIMLGAYWAYGVLGWGGYWGWDPVENSSLVPWLTSMGLLHTLLAQRRTGKFVRTNYFLALISFVLVIYSTFLTRSGILGDASVHSFTNPGAAIYWLLLVFLGIAAIGGLVLLGIRWKTLAPEPSGSKILTRECALGGGTLSLLLIAFVVLFGTSLPIFSKTRVEPAFYDATNLPIAIVMGILIGASLYLQWEEQDWRRAFRRSLRALVAALLMTVVLVLMGVKDVMIVGLAFASILTLFVNIDIAITVAKGNWRFLGGKLAHMGLAIFFLGVIGSGKYSDTQHGALPKDSPQQVLGFGMTYLGSRQLPDGKFAFDVRVESGSTIYSLSPVMFEAAQQGIMRNPDIATSALRDIYLSPVSLEGGAATLEGAPQEITIRKGETLQVGTTKILLTGFEMTAHGAAMSANEMPIGAQLKISDGAAEETITPITVFRANSAPRYRSVESRLLKSLVTLKLVNVGMGSGGSSAALELQALDSSHQQPETLVVEASVKPYINLVWIGTILMMVGFIFSIVNRSKES
jgi:cytochrome c-type biogenesis protein CcmF